MPITAANLGIIQCVHKVLLMDIYGVYADTVAKAIDIVVVNEIIIILMIFFVWIFQQKKPNLKVFHIVIK